MAEIKKIPTTALSAVTAFVKKVLGIPALSPECSHDEGDPIHDNCSWHLDGCECDCHDAESNEEVSEFLRSFPEGA